VGLPAGRRRSAFVAGRRDGGRRARTAGSGRLAGGGPGAMSEPGTAGGFVSKWRARWPEWGVAEAFGAADQRQVAGAWVALLQELYDAAWSGQDPTPGLAKLAWWHEELEGWDKGGRRHPLGEVLQRLPAPWTRLGRARNALPSTRGQSAAEAAPSLPDLAEAVAGRAAALVSIHGHGNGAA